MRKFIRLPYEVMLDERLTHQQLRVLQALCSFRNTEGQTVWPSRAVLAKLARVKETRVSEITGELVRLGWLAKVGNGGRSHTVRYVVTVPPFLRFTDGQTVPEMGTVSSKQTVPEMGTVSSKQTVPEMGTVSETIPAAGMVSDTETVPDLVKTVPDLGTKTVPVLGTGIKQTREQTKEQTRGTRAREALAAPPPPQKGEAEHLGGAGGAGASVAQGTAPVPAPAAAGNAPSPLPSPPVRAGHGGGEGMGLAAPPPLHPAAQRAELAAALAADAAKRHPLCPPEVPAEVFNDWLALRREKHAPVNATVIRIAREEADRAGMSLSRFLEQWCLAGSARFSADWLIADRQQAERAGKTFREIDEENERRRVAQLCGGAGKVIELSDTEYWKRRQKEYEQEQRQRALARKQQKQGG